MVDSDVALIRAIAHGDPDAFESLVRRYQNPLFNFIARYLGDRSAAEDVAQDVFLRVYQSAARFDPKARVSTWIFKIAYNLSINELKRRSRFVPIAGAERGEAAGLEQEPSAELVPQSEMEEEILAALSQLPENQKAALLLRVNEELSYREIGEILNVSISSVESLLFRARQTLKERLGRERKKRKT